MPPTAEKSEAPLLVTILLPLRGRRRKSFQVVLVISFHPDLKFELKRSRVGLRRHGNGGLPGFSFFDRSSHRAGPT